MNRIIQLSAATALLLGCAFHANVTTAASLKGSLATGLSVMDAYQVTCSSSGGTATDHLTVNILNSSAANSPLLSVQAFRGLLGGSATDAVAGNAAASPTITLKGGNSIYSVNVEKAAAVAVNYTLTYTCYNSANVATGTVLKTLQNQ